ncbi:hypothetical protein CALCODRAFT_329144 [Calocera cornea HHB12733]|uniref:F-box domain-containing protein n=1 Tax=Calocera cornea HHB12733 TaxID=1353952 RepID=A0A165JIU7_9BASI|nr:hypothetical protein CALCODRAFT_329144 [Calocera cornea HHB12733]
MLVFSFTQVAVVRVDVGESATSFMHTGALDFFPDPYATTPQTPGITAVARLATKADPDFMRRTSNAALAVCPISRLHSIIPQIFPLEVWIRIAEYLKTLEDLKAMGYTSQHCRLAVAEVLRDVQLPYYRLLHPFNWTPPTSASQCEEAQDTLGLDLCDYIFVSLSSKGTDETRGKLELRHAAFLASGEHGLRIVHLADQELLWPLVRRLNIADSSIDVSSFATGTIGCSAYFSYPLGARIRRENLRKTERMIFL